MQGNNALLAKTLRKIQNQLYGQPVLTFDEHQICSAICLRGFEWALIELRFKITKNFLY